MFKDIVSGAQDLFRTGADALFDARDFLQRQIDQFDDGVIRLARGAEEAGAGFRREVGATQGGRIGQNVGQRVGGIVGANPNLPWILALGALGLALIVRG